MLSYATLERDAESYLVNPDDWSHDLAAELAAEENIGLTEAYWPIFEFIRGYWDEHKIIPDVRHVVSHMVEVQGIDKKAAKQQMFHLFPYGYVKQACKIAGMQRPRGWSTG